MKRERLNAFIDAIRTLRALATDEQALASPAIYPEWAEDKAYTVDERVLYEDVLYRCLQGHTSQESWNPADAASLWARVLIPDPDVIPEWVQPDSTNPYMRGDKVRHNGKIWVSLVDHNIWEPSEALPTIWQEVAE